MGNHEAEKILGALVHPKTLLTSLFNPLPIHLYFRTFPKHVNINDMNCTYLKKPNFDCVLYDPYIFLHSLLRLPTHKWQNFQRNSRKWILFNADPFFLLIDIKPSSDSPKMSSPIIVSKIRKVQTPPSLFDISIFNLILGLLFCQTNFEINFSNVLNAKTGTQTGNMIDWNMKRSLGNMFIFTVSILPNIERGSTSHLAKSFLIISKSRV